MKKQLATTLFTFWIAAGVWMNLPADAATIVTTGQYVGGGTTLDLTLNAASVAASSNMDSNDGSGNLVLTYPTGAVDDFWINWTTVLGTTVPSATYKYLQVDFLSVSAGAVAGTWSASYIDDDNGDFGSSIHAVGSVTPQTTPFSVVLDMTSAPSGREWGPGNITGLRLDMFETGSNGNDGKVFTISGVTLGSDLITPSSTISLDLNSTNSADISLESGDNEFDFNATNGGSGLDVDYLIVAGGGGGGAAKRTTGAGGGGAGGLLEGTTTLTGAEGIVVGDGGDGGTSPSSSGTNGDDSSAFGETAIGGGGGASSTSAASMKGNPGGSGGGGSADTGGSGTALQGNAGGNSTAIATGGGGGGAGGVGGTPTGGDGLPSTITGTSVDYAAGGDGNVYSGAYADGANGAVNTGNGGGGAKSAGSSTIKNGGKGGSGIVVVRYTGDNLLTGGTVSTVGADTVHTFTSVGSSTLGFNATIDGDISGDGNLIWNGGGTLTLNGTNTYTGTTTIDSGSTLQIGSGGTTGTLPTGDVLNNGALVFNRSDITTITNDVSGTGSVEHAGSGTLELTGTLTYDGPTSVTGGGILEMASGSFGALSVGNGTLSIDSSGIGEINLVANSLTLNNGATIDWQFTDSTDGNYDQIVSTAGDLLGSGTITIHVSGFGDYSVSKGDRFKLYDGTVSEGAFDNFAFVFSGDNYQYWTMELGSLDIVSTIPEPSTAILAGLGLAGMCLRRRKRK
ncbi:MAG: PEP-CTERM sorting domain-containing protein [Lentisphaeria bacterium]|nr:PEP-CTERM sorting domain-containing protein [Lentisphaeria bacterium]